MLYYRGTRTNKPMSDWGHAMFTDTLNKAYFDPETNDGYGWTFDGTLGTPITALKDLIINTWNYDIENTYGGDFWNNSANDYYRENLSAEEVYNSFNPSDIVDSAEGWDSELTQWFWFAIAEPNDIMAITTYDGAIVFDADLIKGYKN